MEFSYKLVQNAQFSRSIRKFNALSSLSGSLKSKRAKGSSAGDFESAISSTASIVASTVEKYTAKSLGMTIVPTTGGLGASPDLVSPNPKGVSLVAEIKAIVPEFSGSVINKLRAGSELSSSRKGLVGFNSPISITTSGVSVRRGSSRSLTVGFRGSNALTKTFDNDVVDQFYDRYSNNLELLKSHLENPSSADSAVKPLVKALRLNLYLKAKSIFIPVAIDSSTVLIGNLSFKSKELFSNANSFLDVKFSEGSILVNLKIPQSLLNDAFRNASENIFNDVVTNGLLSSVESFMESNISSKAELLSKDYETAVKEAASVLKRKRISVGAEFAKGSIIASSIKFKYPKAKKNIAELSIIDLTALVRGRTKLKMRRGAGNPTPPNIYERSGVFRGSIQVVANINSNMIDYFYLPYYDSLEKYGYRIDNLVESSIRDIARERLGQEFILRKNTQPIN